MEDSMIGFSVTKMCLKTFFSWTKSSQTVGQRRARPWLPAEGVKEECSHVKFYKLHGYRLQRCSEVCESNSVWSKRCFKVIKGWTTKLPVCSIRGSMTWETPSLHTPPTSGLGDTVSDHLSNSVTPTSCSDESAVWRWQSGLKSLSLSSSFIFTRHFLSVLLSTNKCNTLNVVLETSPKDVHFYLHTYYTVKSPSCLMAGCSLHLHVAVWGGSSTNQRVGDG